MPAVVCVRNYSKQIGLVGVIVLDVRWLFLIANWILWFIQTWNFDVLPNCQHTNMLFLCMLHVKSTVSFFIHVLEVTNYQPLVYHILLLC